MKVCLLKQVRSALERNRGRWPEIQHRAGLGYNTVRRIANGDTADPGVLRVQKLLHVIERLEAGR